MLADNSAKTFHDAYSAGAAPGTTVGTSTGGEIPMPEFCSIEKDNHIMTVTLERPDRLNALTFDYIKDTGAAMIGNPDRCTEIAKRYEAAGCDLLFCLVNPYDIGHDEVMNSIEHIGKYVIPEFDKD